MNRRYLALIIIALIIFTFSACKSGEKTVIISPEADFPDIIQESISSEEDDINTELIFAEKYEYSGGTYGKDFASLYDLYGKNAEPSDVVFVDGEAYINFEGKLYLLGLDFLSRAMIENSDPGDAVSYEFWSELYLKRLNYLCPEIPMASSESYAAAPKKSSEFSSAEELAEIIMSYGNTDELTIVEFNSVFSGLASEESIADKVINILLSQSSAVIVDANGVYSSNDAIIESIEKNENSDGSAVFTVNLNKGISFSTGKTLKAEDFLVLPLIIGKTETDLHADYSDFSYIEGYLDYYYGKPGAPCSGLRLLSDYSFSVSVSGDYLPNYYELSYLDWCPIDSSMMSVIIKDDGAGAYIASEYNEISNDVTPQGNAGPYYYGKTICTNDLTEVSLIKNKYNSSDSCPETIKIIFSEKSYTDQNIDDDYSDAVILNLTKNESESFSKLYPGHKINSIPRSGYSRLFFRNDIGAASFEEVRRAFALCFDYSCLSSALEGMIEVPGGGIYYGIANTPSENEYVLDYSLEKAIKELERAGYVFGENGKAYSDGVRYKKILKKEYTEMVYEFSSLDGKVKPYTLDGYVYIPLVINIIASESPVLNSFVEYMASEKYFPTAGFYISLKKASFDTVMDEYCMENRQKPIYNAFVGGVDRISPKADFSGEHTIDPALYDKNQYFFLCDTADKVKIK